MQTKIFLTLLMGGLALLAVLPANHSHSDYVYGPSTYNINEAYDAKLKEKINFEDNDFDFGNAYYDYCDNSLGDSMWPCYAYVFEDAKYIARGDIVLIKITGSEKLLKHRVVDIIKEGTEEYYITKGDRNKKPDPTYWKKEDITYVVIAEFK